MKRFRLSNALVPDAVVVIFARDLDEAKRILELLLDRQDDPNWVFEEWIGA